MTATTAVPLVNGFAPSTLDRTSEAQEYEKILKLRDEIFSGTHPRLTVPAHAIRKVSPLSASHSTVTTNVSPPLSTATHQNHLPGLSIGAGGEKQSGGEQNVNNPSTVTTQVKAATASGIDPVLLMKSDELVKAETQLHRQRLEKDLRDQFERKRLDARKKPAIGEAKPDFDVAAVLARAQEIVKVEAVPSPKDDIENSDSYDENSLYSSRAPDSTPEVGELEDSVSSQNQNPYGASFGANGPAEPQARVVPPATIVAVPTPRANSPIGRPRKPSGPVDNVGTENDEEGEDDEEEGEYSPPEAVEQFTTSNGTGLQSRIDSRTRPLRRYSELDDHNNGKRPGSPNDNVRIVRNHISSPIAPQPSRVSPLAVAKDPFTLQNNRIRNGRMNQRGRADSPHQSPDGSSQGLHPRKKRRIDKKAEKRKRNGRGSPDIKDEPVSPPPFHDVQPLGSGKIRPTANDRPIIIDDGPVREARYVQAADPYLSSPGRPGSRQADPMMTLTEPRVMSRNVMRSIRDDADLRRVASMHNMRAEQPREFVDSPYDTPTRARATSYVRVDSPMRMEQSRLIHEVTPGYGREANQGVRVARTPNAVYREVYTGSEPEVRYVPEPMPPPTIERIVVDQYGRRFREIVEDRSSVAPRYSAVPDREQSTYYENFDRGRAPSMMVEKRADGRTGQEMRPPQILRQVADQPEPGFREVYEAMPPLRASSVRPIDQPPTRQSVFVDDRAEYRAPMRMGSVRPSGVRYEDMLPPPPQMAARASSVRPGAREGSIFVDDRSQIRREYLPAEAPRYRVVEPETRYVDAQGREISYVDGTQDGGQRYMQRY